MSARALLYNPEESEINSEIDVGSFDDEGSFASSVESASIVSFADIGAPGTAVAPVSLPNLPDAPSSEWKQAAYFDQFHWRDPQNKGVKKFCTLAIGSPLKRQHRQRWAASTRAPGAR